MPTIRQRTVIGVMAVASFFGVTACDAGPVNYDTCAKLVATQELDTGIELAQNFQAKSGIDIREVDAGSDIHDVMRDGRIAFQTGDSTNFCVDSKTGRYEVGGTIPSDARIIDLNQ